MPIKSEMKQQQLWADPTAEDSLPEDWVDEHADAMYGFALARVHDRHAAEDLVQEAYLAAYRARNGFRGDSSLRTWLIAILRLKIIDHFRRKSRESAFQPGQAEELGRILTRESRLEAWNCHPENTIENKEFWGVFQACLSKLPDTLSKAFLLREIDGCSTHEICRLLSITSENLAVRMFRARSALRDCLEQHWFSKD